MPWSTAYETGDRLHGFGEFGVASGIVALGGCLNDAVAKVLVDEPDGDALEGGRNCRQLSEHVDAVLVCFDHVLQAPYLTFDAAEADVVVVSVDCVATHLGCSSSIRVFAFSIDPRCHRE
jgi:hypothetical protein